MAYQALYRKYRPMNFNDVVGQDIIVQTLKNALKTSKTSHAYLFSGPRGTGKTTIAKIFAKAINCLDLHDGIPCDKCTNCLSIISNESTDIIEIDAASNNGVDEIREIRNKINLVPSDLKYKVYIIDEVHMLSVGAFNALLKTLEEPPDHAVFILATTDPHKVPVTIISRCQCFEFKRIADDIIVDRLNTICEKENIEIEDEVLKKIAMISEGGMRDSLGLLDKVSSYCSDKITFEDFQKIGGFVSDDMVKKFIKLVSEKNILEILSIIEDLYSSGKDFIIFSQDLMNILRKYMIEYYVDNNEIYSIDFLLNFINMLNRLLVNLKNSSNLKILFETSILAFLGEDNRKSQHEQKFENEFSLQKLDSTVKNNQIEPKTDCIISNTEKCNSEIQNFSQTIKQMSQKEDFSIRFEIVNNTFATAKKEYLLKIKEEWVKLNDFVLDKSYGAAACYLVDSKVRAVGDNEMIITCNYESVLNRGFHLLITMEELLNKIFLKKYKIAILTDSEWNKEKQKFIEAKNRGDRYIYKDLSEKHEQNVSDSEEKNNLEIEQDDIVQQAISIFGEDIVKIK